MSNESGKPKRRWGAAILSWLGFLVAYALVAEFYTKAKYASLNSLLGTDVQPSSTFAPWWATLLFFGGCFYTGKKFLFPEDDQKK